MATTHDQVHEEAQAADHTAHAGHQRRPYVAIFFWLLGLTVFEVSLFFVPEDYHTLTIPVLLVLALSKAVLVAMYYMHLRYDPRSITLGISIAVLLALMFGLVITLGAENPREPEQVSSLVQALLAPLAVVR